LEEFKENMKATGIDDESSERIFNILHEKINAATMRSSAKKARTKRGGKSKSKNKNKRRTRRIRRFLK
jgi:ribosomal protein L23